jgi:imidazole glycerol-phosphate synthase subunit HisH
MIVVVDYGMGNLRSVQKAFELLGIKALITSDLNKIRLASKIVLPGVGHYSKGMQNLNETGIAEVLREEVLIKRKPVLGICLGMQLMTKHSEEGDVDGLGFVDGQTIRFSSLNNGLKIPHMGWNDINRVKYSYLLGGIDLKSQMYFVHSYLVKCENKEDVLFTTEYGITFESGFEHQNIVGFQFHPEKSHKPGLQLIANFSKL